jgi:hypothetical protein
MSAQIVKTAYRPVPTSRCPDLDAAYLAAEARRYRGIDAWKRAQADYMANSALKNFSHSLPSSIPVGVVGGPTELSTGALAGKRGRTELPEFGSAIVGLGIQYAQDHGESTASWWKGTPFTVSGPGMRYDIKRPRGGIPSAVPPPPVEPPQWGPARPADPLTSTNPDMREQILEEGRQNARQLRDWVEEHAQDDAGAAPGQTNPNPVAEGPPVAAGPPMPLLQTGGTGGVPENADMGVHQGLRTAISSLANTTVQEGEDSAAHLTQSAAKTLTSMAVHAYTLPSDQIGALLTHLRDADKHIETNVKSTVAEAHAQKALLRAQDMLTAVQMMRLRGIDKPSVTKVYLQGIANALETRGWPHDPGVRNQTIEAVLNDPHATVAANAAGDPLNGPVPVAPTPAAQTPAEAAPETAILAPTATPAAAAAEHAQGAKRTTKEPQTSGAPARSTQSTVASAMNAAMTPRNTIRALVQDNWDAPATAAETGARLAWARSVAESRAPQMTPAEADVAAASSVTRRPGITFRRPPPTTSGLLPFASPQNQTADMSLSLFGMPSTTRTSLLGTPSTLQPTTRSAAPLSRSTVEISPIGADASSNVSVVNSERRVSAMSTAANPVYRGHELQAALRDAQRKWLPTPRSEDPDVTQRSSHQESPGITDPVVMPRELFPEARNAAFHGIYRGLRAKYGREPTGEEVHREYARMQDALASRIRR